MKRSFLHKKLMKKKLIVHDECYAINIISKTIFQHSVQDWIKFMQIPLIFCVSFLNIKEVFKEKERNKKQNTTKRKNKSSKLLLHKPCPYLHNSTFGNH